MARQQDPGAKQQRLIHLSGETEETLVRGVLSETHGCRGYLWSTEVQISGHVPGFVSWVPLLPAPGGEGEADEDGRRFTV